MRWFFRITLDSDSITSLHIVERDEGEMDGVCSLTMDWKCPKTSNLKRRSKKLNRKINPGYVLWDQQARSFLPFQILHPSNISHSLMSPEILLYERLFLKKRISSIKIQLLWEAGRNKSLIDQQFIFNGKNEFMIFLLEIRFW